MNAVDALNSYMSKQNGALPQNKALSPVTSARMNATDALNSYVAKQRVAYQQQTAIAKQQSDVLAKQQQQVTTPRVTIGKVSKGFKPVDTSKWANQSDVAYYEKHPAEAFAQGVADQLFNYIPTQWMDSENAARRTQFENAQNGKFGINDTSKTGIFTPGNIGGATGLIGQMALTGGVAKALSEAAPIAKVISNPIVRQGVTNTLFNTALQTPGTINNGIDAGETKSQIVKNLALQTAGNVAFSFGIPAIGRAISNSAAQQTENKAVANAYRLLPPKLGESTTSVRPKLSFNDTGELINHEPIKAAPTKQYVYDSGMDLSKETRPTDTSSKLGNYVNRSANTQGIIDTAVNEENLNRSRTNKLADNIRGNVNNVEDRQAATVAAELTPQEINDRLQGKDAFITDGENLINRLKNSDTAKAPKMSVEYKTNMKNIKDTQASLKVLNERIPQNIKNLDRPLEVDGTKTTMRQLLTNAQNLSGNAKEAANNATDFTTQVGALSKARHTIDGTVDKYLVHDYNQPDISSINDANLEANRQTALQSRITLKNGGGTGINNSAERVYKDYATAVMHGENPKTLDIANLVEKTGNDQAHANATQGVLNNMVKENIATANNRVFDGFKEIGKTQDGLKIQLPIKLANALDPILNPDYGKGYGGKTWTDIASKIKAVNLGLSLFHYKNLGIAAVNNGDFSSLTDLVAKLPHIVEFMKSPEWQANIEDSIKNGGMYSQIQGNVDTLMKLNKDSLSPAGKLLDKAGELPGLKQVAQLSNANNQALFEVTQTFLKGNAYATDVAEWLGKNPNATDYEITMAKRSINREINGNYGGLNWKSLRIPRQLLGVMKMTMLAPDWTTSNADLLRQALNPLNHSPGASMARAFWVRNVALGAAMLEGLNYAFTGHGTWQNPKGHELNVEMAPNTYITPLSGAMKDVATLTGDITKSGSQGIPQFALSKLNAPSRTILGIASNKDYYGRSLTDAKGNLLKTTGNVASFAGQNMLPLPFGATGLLNYAKDRNAAKTPLGAALIGTGLGSYSADQTQKAGVFANPQKAYAGNWLNTIINSVNPKTRAAQDITNKIGAFKTAATANSTAAKQYAGAVLQKGGNIGAVQLEQKFGITASQAKSTITDAQNSLKSQQYSDVVSKYEGMSATNRQKLFASLSPQAQQTLSAELAKYGLQP